MGTQCPLGVMKCAQVDRGGGFTTPSKRDPVEPCALYGGTVGNVNCISRCH